MTKRRKNPFRGVNVYEDRHGKLRHRLRRRIKGRTIDVQLPGPFGSAKFRRAYEEAIKGARASESRVPPGTVGFLIVHYLASAAYRDLKPVTRANKRSRLDRIRRIIGDLPYASIKPRHIEQLMDKMGGPEAANRCRSEVRQLFRFAVKHYGYTGPNPAALADPRKVVTEGHHTWEDGEIELFRAAFPSATKPRLVFEVFLCSGAPRQDAARMTRANVRGGRIGYRRGKTGQEVDLPILPVLAAELAHLPSAQMVLIGRNDGRKGYTPESLGNWFRDRCNEVGLPKCSAHGLRKAGARLLAEAGASESEVMSYLGHRTTREASRYVAAASRARLGDSGMATLGKERA